MPTNLALNDEYLDLFPLLVAETGAFLAAARLYRLCRERGLGASTIDCHIAAAAIENECRLLTTDRDFERISRISPFQLL